MYVTVVAPATVETMTGFVVFLTVRARSIQFAGLGRAV